MAKKPKKKMSLLKRRRQEEDEEDESEDEEIEPVTNEDMPEPPKAPSKEAQRRAMEDDGDKPLDPSDALGYCHAVTIRALLEALEAIRAQCEFMRKLDSAILEELKALRTDLGE